jgi:hypothetical protein
MTLAAWGAPERPLWRQCAPIWPGCAHGAAQAAALRRALTMVGHRAGGYERARGSAARGFDGSVEARGSSAIDADATLVLIGLQAIGGRRASVSPQPACLCDVHSNCFSLLYVGQERHTVAGACWWCLHLYKQLRREALRPSCVQG